MTLTKKADLNGLYHTIYEDAVFTARDENLMAALVTTFNDEGYADRVIPVYNGAEAVNVADGVDFVTGRKLSKSVKATFTPGEVMAQFILSDQDLKTDPDAAAAAAARELGGAMAEKIDKDLLGLFAGFAQSKGTAGSALTLAHCGAALSVIRKNKARGRASFVTHPYPWNDIWLELGKPQANQAFLGETANQALRDYVVGSFIGSDWFITSNIDIDLNGDTYGAVFVREAIALDVRDPVTLREQRDESLRATELNLHTGYAYGTLWGDRGASLLSDATEPV